jgi:hypothetical protein
MNRRSFLKRAGGVALAVVAAPLYIPPSNLDYGVPIRNLSLSTDIEAAVRRSFRSVAYYTGDEPIPMLLMQGEYTLEFGTLPAGSQVMVDRETAERWMDYRVAVPGPGAPDNLVARSARREAERTTTLSWKNTFIDAEKVAAISPIPDRELTESAMSRHIREMLRA